jgi:hypothetical protein
MNLVEALARELVRVSRLRSDYEAIGPAGQFALNFMRTALEKGCTAIGSGDISEMALAYNELVGFKS